MIAVVSTSYREADILEMWLMHLLSEGVDLVLIADKLSDDGTRGILDKWKSETGQIEWVDDDQPYHRQAWWTNRLAEIAHNRGAEWILPADIDEFPYALDGSTVGEALKACSAAKLILQVFPHVNWATRFVTPHMLGKVAFRWSPDAIVPMGSHNVSLPGGEHNVLAMRELQYRSFDHYCRKANDRNATLEPDARSRGDGWHHLRLEHMNDEELRNEWELMCAAQTIHDPIPSHARLLSLYGGLLN